MDVFTELRCEERHECRAAIVSVRNGQSRRTAGERRRIALRLLQEVLRCQVTIGISRMEDGVVLLKPLHEPLRTSVVTPAARRPGILYCVVPNGNVLGHQDFIATAA